MGFTNIRECMLTWIHWQGRCNNSPPAPPDINLRVDPTRSRISGVRSQPLLAGTALISNDFRVAIEMSYELDAWGKYRSGALASQNDLTKARNYREMVRIGVAADVANAYFRLRAADAELGTAFGRTLKNAGAGAVR